MKRLIYSSSLLALMISMQTSASIEQPLFDNRSIVNHYHAYSAADHITSVPLRVAGETKTKVKVKEKTKTRTVDEDGNVTKTKIKKKTTTTTSSSDDGGDSSSQSSSSGGYTGASYEGE
ncbi:MAG: hypothetical protein ABW098_05870 [Candidatus Thiodiazotropha sp.]